MSLEDKKKKAMEALSQVVEESLQKDVVSAGLVKNLRMCGGNLALDLEVPSQNPSIQSHLKQKCHSAILAVEGIDHVSIKVIPRIAPPSPGGRSQKTNILPQVKYTLAVGSGKGGVGKSTVAVNLAVSLMEKGFKVGLLDVDIYGPSIPLMLGLQEQEPTMNMSGKLLPTLYEKLKVVSVGILAKDETPLIWRGPMVTQLTQQFLQHVEWGELDYMIMDLPPGTGDIQITLCQSIPLSGALIVTSPQDICFTIARKALNMFERLQVPVLGVVENMAGYACSGCGKTSHIFGESNIEHFCQEAECVFLGKIPMESHIVESGDSGKPFSKGSPQSASGQAFQSIVDKLIQKTQKKEDEDEEVSSSPQIRYLRQPSPTEIEIEWKDGAVANLTCKDIRGACPCAVCIDEWSGEILVNKKDVPLDVHPLQIKWVGNYAVQFEWSDGHSTGIYTYDHLHRLSTEAARPEESSFEI